MIGRRRRLHREMRRLYGEQLLRLRCAEPGPGRKHARLFCRKLMLGK
jgi:hypothetical protein